MPTPQVAPAGHGSQVADWVLGMYVPSGHACGSAEPVGHLFPAGHGMVAAPSPPGQKKPAVHGLVMGLVCASWEQKNPGGQMLHCPTACKPSSADHRPRGHGKAEGEPPGQ